jgi:hypothetical protein
MQKEVQIYIYNVYLFTEHLVIPTSFMTSDFNHDIIKILSIHEIGVFVATTVPTVVYLEYSEH